MTAAVNLQTLFSTLRQPLQALRKLKGLDGGFVNQEPAELAGLATSGKSPDSGEAVQAYSSWLGGVSDAMGHLDVIRITYIHDRQLFHQQLGEIPLETLSGLEQIFRQLGQNISLEELAGVHLNFSYTYRKLLEVQPVLIEIADYIGRVIEQKASQQ